MSKKIALLLKTIIVLVSFGFIVVKIYTESQNAELIPLFKHLKSLKVLLLVPILIMAGINWGAETIKWQFIIKKLQYLSFKKCLRAILAGITVAIFTPNRIGEFGGRILALERKNRIAGIFATLLGGYAQLLTTLIVGLVALPFYFKLHPTHIKLVTNWQVLFLICLVVILLGLIVYFNIKFFARLIERFIKNDKKKRFVKFLADYTFIDLIKILFLSFIRYLVFSTQFFMLLILFNINIGYAQSIMCIGLVYMIMTIVPVLSFFEFGVRGSVALLVFSVYTTSSLGIISTSLLLWLINLALPALIGSMALYKLKL